jgi:hypothetical protein
MNVLGVIVRLLGKITCQCASGVYTLDDDGMSNIYYCRDIGQVQIKDYNRQKIIDTIIEKIDDAIACVDHAIAAAESEKEKASKLLFDQNVENAAQQDEQ